MNKQKGDVLVIVSIVIIVSALSVTGIAMFLNQSQDRSIVTTDNDLDKQVATSSEVQSKISQTATEIKTESPSLVVSTSSLSEKKTGETVPVNPKVKLMVLLSSTKTPMSVQADPPPLKTCDPSSMCYELGTNVTLRPTDSSTVYSWTGCDQSGNDSRGNYCTVKLSSIGDYIINVGLSGDQEALPVATSHDIATIAVQLSSDSPDEKVVNVPLPSTLQNAILGVFSFNSQNQNSTLNELAIKINYNNGDVTKVVRNVRIFNGSAQYVATSFSIDGIAKFTNLNIPLTLNIWKDLVLKVDVLPTIGSASVISATLRPETIKAVDNNSHQASVRGYMQGSAVPSYVEAVSYLSGRSIDFNTRICNGGVCR